MGDVEVIRYGIWNEVTKTVSGDYLCVAGRTFGLRYAADLEYRRAARVHPENPAFNMRPMFYTGSPFGREILELLDGATP